jgi:CubicO group peptidase (beta-lactamase class C family)
MADARAAFGIPNGPGFAPTAGAGLTAGPADAVAAADQRLIAALKDYIPHVMRLTGTPGLNLALARRGEVIWDEGFGYADLERRTPMTADTVAHSGSMAKVYTAIAALQLVDRGAIALDRPINDYLKGVRAENPLGRRDITVRDLLTHRSGLNENAAGSMYRIPPLLADHIREGYAAETFRGYARSMTRRWGCAVGERFIYSNFGMATLGYVVECANPEGLSFSDYVARHILEPLGMTSSQFPPVQAPPHARADLLERGSTGYAALGHVLVKTPTVHFADFPAGSVLTIPREHIRLLLALANDGRYGDVQLLAPETAQAMVTPQTEMGVSGLGEPIHFGLGVQLTDVGKPSRSFAHGGAHMFGWVNMFRAYPDLGFAYAVFTNHWTILPARTGEALMIDDFIRTWVKNEAGGVGVARGDPGPGWAWKTSYVAGLAIAEQLMGLLGIEEPLSDDAIAAMARDAFLHTEAANFASGWDPDGFRTGVADMQALPMTIESIRQALATGAFKVTADELAAIGRQFGLPDSPLLMSVGEA